MFCSRCGTPITVGAGYCNHCGATIAPTAVSAPATPTAPGPAPPIAVGAGAAAPRYGGFWRRFWAFSIDRLLVGMVVIPFFGVACLHALRSLDTGLDPAPDQLFELFAAFATMATAAAALGWLYFALMESSGKQATLGKRALGLRVTGLDGGRISFGRASGRYFAKILSGLILSIGFIMAAFTARKQALHDLIAATLVVRDGGET